MQDELFKIFLTIDGTPYVEVPVLIPDPLLTLSEQVERIVRLFELPKIDKGGTPVCYLLGRPKEDGDVEKLESFDENGREQCLLDYNIRSGDHLRLVTLVILGSGETNAECMAADPDWDADYGISDDLGIVYHSDIVETVKDNRGDSDSEVMMIERMRRYERELMERLERERVRLEQERINLMREREGLEQEIEYLKAKRESLEREREELERVREQLKQERWAQYQRLDRGKVVIAKKVNFDLENKNGEAKTFLMKTQQKEKSGVGRKLLERLNIVRQKVYGSIFAPAEIKPSSHMLVQVYLHLYEETEKVRELAKEPQKGAERRDYISMRCKLKKGDQVDVLLNIYGKTLLMSEKKSMVWQGSFTKCSFDYLVPSGDEVNELSCIAMLSVNGIPVGEMSFVTSVVDFPRELNPEVVSRNYQKVFISYAHEDMPKVISFHEGLKLFKIEHFFDRETLDPGAIYSLKIQEYINTADLFVLFWSKNAAESDYVQLELNQALERTYPKVQPPTDAKLRIYPLSIEPRAEFPECLQPHFHFGVL